MFNNWWKDFDPLNYEGVKKNVTEFNKKIIGFWTDFYKDVEKQFNEFKK